MTRAQILLTGGTGGLGRGVVKVLLKQYTQLTLSYHSESARDALIAELSAEELVRVRFVLANLLDEAQVQQLVDGMEHLDALVHLVGSFNMGPTADYAYEDWQRDLDLNLTTTFLVCKYSLRRMQATGYGRIVTVGSRGSEQPGAQAAAYCASKAAVKVFTQAIAEETKGTNITANVVLPSVIDTPANREAMGAEQAEQWVKPEAIADVIAFLISEAARDVRGAAIAVYGHA